MSLKAGLTPIEELAELPVGARRTLRDLSVTTVEEFVGMARATPNELSQQLGLDGRGLQRLVVAGERRLGRAAVVRLKTPPPDYPLGAWDPRKP